MPGLHNNGLPQISKWAGSELHNMDTLIASGSAPQEAMSSTVELATAIAFYNNNTSKTMVAGTRYFRNIVLGTATSITGISVLVGSTGGTDLWNVELHDSTGATLATSLLTGTTAGTAGTFQQIAFTAALTVAAGTYFIVVQSNGTTAKFGAFNSPTSPLLTGSATGTLGTAASITPPTTYTAGLGPVAIPY